METAMKEMQNYKLEGHALQLKPSSAKKSSGHPENAPKSDEQSTKIMVRNLAFQATAKEVRALFSEFGELKKVRLPKKFDGNNRGFAFVEFLTAKEARAAFSALASTHLYGRHLVLEWAQEDAGVEELRGKAARAAGLMSGGDGSGGARKKRKADAIFEDLF
uniref:RRM domain-containing protein n=1 Tax=Heterosigma akashiwo TaxID=2829 RepID=A0A7S3XJY5_HETAK